MAVTWTTRIDGDLLAVTAQGFDESPEDARAYGLAVVQTAVEAGSRRVLCDERALEYRIGTLELFEIAKHLADVAPKVARIAIVPNGEGMDDASFFSDVAYNRGLSVSSFPSVELAMEWLNG